MMVSPMSEKDLQRSQRQRQRFVGTRYFYIPQFGEVIGAGLILMMGVYLSDIYIVNEYYHLINALWILKRK